MSITTPIEPRADAALATAPTTVESDRDALVDRLFEATIGTLELFGVYIGERLGLYRWLATVSTATAPELATHTGIHTRYATEWLEQQAVSGMLVVEGDGAERRFVLPAAHREVLADAGSASYLAPFALMLAGIGQALPDVVDAYRTGGGVPWARYGADGRDGQSAINRPLFEAELEGWVRAMPDIHARLTAGGGRIADVGCGGGWSTMALARAFPGVHVDGLDVDEAAVHQAAATAAAAGLDGSVAFHVGDAVEGLPTEGGRYDLVCILEALHDMPRPVEALAAARSSLAAGGAVLVVDERVADEFVAPGDAVERMMYGWSITCCLPAGMAEHPSAATGTVMRRSVLEGYARDAGFRDVTVLDIDNEVFRMYRLDA